MLFRSSAQLIDLEKTRPLLLGRRDRIKDLEPLFRRSQHVWTGEQTQWFLQTYLDQPGAIEHWLERLEARRQDKAAR